MRTYSFIDFDREGPRVEFCIDAFFYGKPHFLSTIDPSELAKKLENNLHVIKAEVDIIKADAIKFIRLLGGTFYPAKRVCYLRTREYGGAEEGGWYYTCLSNPVVVDEKTTPERDEVIFDEFLVGENETKGKPIYC
jgi:hypothetical protein